MGTTLPYDRRRDLLERVEQALGLRQAEEVGGAAAQDVERGARDVIGRRGRRRPPGDNDGARRDLEQRDDRVARRQARMHAQARSGNGRAELEEEHLAQAECPGAEAGLGVARVVQACLEIGAHLDAPRHDHGHERRASAIPAAGVGRPRAARSPRAAGPARLLACERATRNRTTAITRNGAAGRPGYEAQEQNEGGRHAQGLGQAEDLPRELLAERRVGFFAGGARHEDAGRDGQDERGDLRDQAVADRQKAVALEARPSTGRPRCATPMARPSEDVDDVMTSDATTSPLTNFIAPSIAP